jgi:hypothetical protein
MTNDPPTPPPDFGEPMELAALVEMATIDADDQNSAIDWFDLHVLDLFWGALEP